MINILLTSCKASYSPKFDIENCYTFLGFKGFRTFWPSLEKWIWICVRVYMDKIFRTCLQSDIFWQYKSPTWMGMKNYQNISNICKFSKKLFQHISVFKKFLNFRQISVFKTFRSFWKISVFKHFQFFSTVTNYNYCNTDVFFIDATMPNKVFFSLGKILISIFSNENRYHCCLTSGCPRQIKIIQQISG